VVRVLTIFSSRDDARSSSSGCAALQLRGDWRSLDGGERLYTLGARAAAAALRETRPSPSAAARAGLSRLLRREALAKDLTSLARLRAEPVSMRRPTRGALRDASPWQARASVHISCTWGSHGPSAEQRGSDVAGASCRTIRPVRSCRTSCRRVPCTSVHTQREAKGASRSRKRGDNTVPRYQPHLDSGGREGRRGSPSQVLVRRDGGEGKHHSSVCDVGTHEHTGEQRVAEVRLRLGRRRVVFTAPLRSPRA
jgi:hypothetical protein